MYFKEEAMKMILVAVLLVLGLFGLCIFGAVVSLNNGCVLQEAGIVAQYKQNQNNYDNYFKKVMEVAQVPDMYTNDLKELYDVAMKGRYGSNGSGAIFQWLQEQNPTLDVGVYIQIQQVMEAGRNSFEVNQKMLLDKKRVYETYIKTFPNNVLASFLGFPKLILSDYDIVTSTETEAIFQQKKSEYLKIK